MQSRLSHPVLLAAVALLGGCSRVGEFARDRADRAAYEVVAATQAAELGEATSFTLTQPADPAAERVLNHTPRLDLADAAFTTPTYSLSLADAVAIAVANNRGYQSARERLFEQALTLTGVRWDYGAIFDASGSASYTRRETEDGLDPGVEEIGARGFTAGLRKQLATGANLSLAFTHDFVRLFSAGPDLGSANTLAFSAVQPLLRGAGSLVAREGLRQSERDMIYAVRTFSLFEQGFAIEAVARHYGLLRSLDALHNAQSNLRNVESNRELLEIQVRNRIRSRLDADQALQRVLAAQALLIDAQTAYRSRLDDFKIFLGIPLDVDIGPDRGDLDMLREREILPPATGLDEAIEAALRDRLDLRTAQDRLADSDRHVQIALRDFLPSLDARYDFRTVDTRDHAIGLDFRDDAQTWGIDLGLPLDWTPRRNAYRLALLDRDSAARSVDELHDRVVAEVREAWRQLDRLGLRVEIARQGIELAQRRVEGTQMMLASGQTTAREMADVQDELLDAQNALTSVMIDYILARLEFWRATGRLRVSDAASTAPAR